MRVKNLPCASCALLKLRAFFTHLHT